MRTKVEVGMSPDKSQTYCEIKIGGHKTGYTANSAVAREMAALRAWVISSSLPQYMELQALRDIEVCEAKYLDHLGEIDWAAERLAMRQKSQAMFWVAVWVLASLIFLTFFWSIW